MLTLKTQISTPNYKHCAKFYEDLLNLERVEEWDRPTDKGIILGVGHAPYGAFIELYHTRVEPDHAGLSLQFKVDDVPKFLAGLSEGLTFEGPQARPWGARYAFLKDPAGVSVVIFDGPTL